MSSHTVLNVVEEVMLVLLMCYLAVTCNLFPLGCMPKTVCLALFLARNILCWESQDNIDLNTQFTIQIVHLPLALTNTGM